jgi:hypothetical protein
MSGENIIDQAIEELKSYLGMEADDDPYRIYLELEKSKAQVSNVHDLLAVQEMCLDLICSDLAEHGNKHLQFYANGKIPENKFIEMHKEITDQLISLLKNTKIRETRVWTAFDKVPLNIEEALEEE